MNLARILVAVDLPNGRDAAFERALLLARSSAAELYLLHAVPANRSFAFGAAKRLERLADLRRRAENSGVRVRTVEQQGDPAHIIELHASARAVDLIVMGGEVRRGWRRYRSLVAERVVRRTDIPTLVVPSDARATPTSFQNVLVALDQSPASSDRTHILEGARRDLEEFLLAAPAGVDVRVRLSTGSAASTILEDAANAKADLVVVGRSRGFKMLGSTAVRVLRKIDRALLIIPSAAPEEELVQEATADAKQVDERSAVRRVA